MTSARKVEANRTNATKSTGPRTARGKSRASHNALRHGLRAVRSRNTTPSAKTLAKAICGNNDKSRNADLYEAALRIAECDILIRRIRAARIAAIEHQTTTPSRPKPPTPTTGFPTAEEYAHGILELARGRPAAITKLLKRGADAVRADAVRAERLQPHNANKLEPKAVPGASEHQPAVDDVALELQALLDRASPRRSDQVRAILGALSHLRKFDRYEQRALSHRERAINDFLALQSLIKSQPSH